MPYVQNHLYQIRAKNSYRRDKMADLTLEEFLQDLLERISQTSRRQLFSYNCNLFEYWTRRLEDYLNVLNVFYQRVQDYQSDHQEEDQTSVAALPFLLF